jgi:lysozyme family protein
MCGVTIGTFTSYRKKVGKPAPTVADLKNITFDEWLDILRTLYWNRWKADQIKSQKIANILVDWVWGSGVYGIKIPQRALRLNPDGIVGPKTLATINNLDPNVLYKALYDLRVDYFNDIIARSVAQYEIKIGRKATDKELKKYTYVRFKIGWMNRLNDIINIK